MCCLIQGSASTRCFRSCNQLFGTTTPWSFTSVPMIFPWLTSKDSTQQVSTTHKCHLGHQPNCRHHSLRSSTKSLYPVPRGTTTHRLPGRSQPESSPTQQLPSFTRFKNTTTTLRWSPIIRQERHYTETPTQ